MKRLLFFSLFFIVLFSCSDEHINNDPDENREFTIKIRPINRNILIPALKGVNRCPVENDEKYGDIKFEIIDTLIVKEVFYRDNSLYIYAGMIGGTEILVYNDLDTVILNVETYGLFPIPEPFLEFGSTIEEVRKHLPYYYDVLDVMYEGYLYNVERYWGRTYGGGAEKMIGIDMNGMYFIVREKYPGKWSTNRHAYRYGFKEKKLSYVSMSFEFKDKYNFLDQYYILTEQKKYSNEILTKYYRTRDNKISVIANLYRFYGFTSGRETPDGEDIVFIPNP
ncbi:MAG: hypothetical protein FWF53_09125 [Candidatus Azobacteroides sp.]|nr:hypothetical protein [Candidatus Azobacteroides sp.]